MATYLADKVICFEGIPAKESFCSSPERSRYGGIESVDAEMPQLFSPLAIKQYPTFNDLQDKLFMDDSSLFKAFKEAWVFLKFDSVQKARFK